MRDHKKVGCSSFGAKKTCTWLLRKAFHGQEISIPGFIFLHGKVWELDKTVCLAEGNELGNTLVYPNLYRKERFIQ